MATLFDYWRVSLLRSRCIMTALSLHCCCIVAVQILQEMSIRLSTIILYMLQGPGVVTAVLFDDERGKPFRVQV